MTMQLRNGIIEAIGNTPLIKLQRVSQATGCTILGKAEFMNPGQSVKDRAALFIIQDAVKRGALKPGGVIVEGTAGNTGIGLALVGNALGFRSAIVIPETQSQEKKDTLRLCGAELVEVPAVPYSNPNNYVKLSGRLAEQLAKSEKHGAIWAISSTMSPTARVRSRRPGRKPGDRRKARSTVLPARSAPAGHLPASPSRSSRSARTCASRSPIRWARRSTAITRPARSSRKAHQSPRGSGKAALPKISKTLRSTSPIRSPTKKPCRLSSTCSSMKGFA